MEIGCPCYQHSLLTLLCQHVRSLVKRTRCQVTKRGKSQHQSIPPCDAGTASSPVGATARVARVGNAFPFSTATCVSLGCHFIRREGQGDGTALGRTCTRWEAVLFCPSAFNAFNTLSGVIGVSSMRTPIAL